MNFNQIKEHIEEEGCSLISLSEDLFYARNCINGNDCLIERLDFYGIGTICHYLYELNVSIPEDFVDFYHVYTNSREEFDRVSQQ